MAKWKRTLERLLSGAADSAIRFDDLRKLLEKFGFSERVKGDHHIFFREGVEEILNLQPKGKDSKAYQVRLVREVLVKSGLIVAEQEEAESNDEDGNETGS